MTLFESLDFLYVTAPDIEASVKYYRDVLGAELVWKIHEFGSKVACFKFSKEGPYIVLADHKKKGELILIYRVKNIEKAAAELRKRGWKEEKSLEIPQGPCYTFRDPADNSIAIYENQRPFFMEKVKGRID